MGKKHDQGTIDKIIELKLQGLSSRKIAEQVFGKKTAKSSVNNIWNRVKGNTSSSEKDKFAKVLTLDVETGMHKGYFFGLFRQHMKPDHILEYPYMLTFACKWLHEDEVHGYKLDDFPLYNIDRKSDYALIEKLWKYLDDCDICIAHNSSFDEGWFNQQCMLHGFPPPSPYKVICTFKALKRTTALPSKSLDYSTQYFRTLDEKRKNDGVSLWVRCLEGDTKALAEMLEYNVGDIPTCEQLYLTIRPFIKGHPNVALYSKNDVPRCRVCGGTHLEKMEGKHAYTDVSVFETVRCSDCGKVQRSGTTINTKEERQNLYRNVV